MSDTNPLHSMNPFIGAPLAIHRSLKGIYAIRKLLVSSLVRQLQELDNSLVIECLRVPVEQRSAAGFTGFQRDTTNLLKPPIAHE